MKDLKKVMWISVVLMLIMAIATIYFMRQQNEYNYLHTKSVVKASVAVATFEHKKIISAQTEKIKALTQENLELRKKLLKKAHLPSHYSNVPAIQRDGRQFTATSYCATGNRTASGVYPRAGRTIAVDRRLIPLGAKVRVRCPSMPQYDGVYTADDTGGAVRGRIIDVFVDSRHEAVSFGRRKVLVEVVK